MFESFKEFKPVEKFKKLKKKELPYDYKDFSDSVIKDKEGNLSTYYYGTNTKKESNNFRPDKHGVIFLTSSFDFAKRFTRNTHAHSDYDKSRIISVNVNAKKVFDFENEKHLMEVIPAIKEKLAGEKMSDIQKKILLNDVKLGNYTGFRNEKVIEVIKEKGYDGYFEFEDFKGETKSLGVFYKEQIKELDTEKIKNLKNSS